MPEATPRPRIWRARIWTKGGPFEGTGFIFKAPIGWAGDAASVLVGLEERYKITRYQLGPVPARVLSAFTHEDREALERFGPALDRAAPHIDWS